MYGNTITRFYIRDLSIPAFLELSLMDIKGHLCFWVKILDTLPIVGFVYPQIVSGRKVMREDSVSTNDQT